MTVRTHVQRWLAGVPDSWQAPLLKLVAKVESGHTPSRQHPEYWIADECVIPWFGLADIWQLRDGTQKYLGETSERVSPVGVANSGARVLPAGTVVLSRTASVGFSGVMPEPMATTQDFVNFVPGPRLTSDFLLWVLRGMKPEFDRLKRGSTHKTIYMPDALQFRTPLPPLPTQRAIAAFLDRKTAAIDDLIDKKERLIALLAEKRAALIHRAVTKGLDDGVPMKDSGVPWIGEIPAHWQVKRLKHLTRQVTVGIVITPSKYYCDDGVPALRSLNVSEGALSQEELVYITHEAHTALSKSRLAEGDLVAVRTGQPGATAVVGPDFDGANCIDLIIIRRPRRVLPGLLAAILNSAATKAQYGAGSTGAIQQHFNVETAKNLLLAVPPEREQVALLRHIDSASAQCDRMADLSLSQIDKLREYRQALITAAVTGQIDIQVEAVA